MPLASFYTPSKDQKISGFLMFSGVQKYRKRPVARNGLSYCMSKTFGKSAENLWLGFFFAV